MVHESGNGRAGVLSVSDEMRGAPGAVVESTDFKERINNYPQITQITQISVFRSNADSELKASFVELARNVQAVSSGGRSIIVARPPIIVLPTSLTNRSGSR